MALGRNVLLLAAVSLLADVSSEMLLAVLPFLLVAQGASGLGIGLVAGASEAVGHLLKPLAGALADRTGRRKPLIVAGYLTAALARVGVALATAWPASLAFRGLDRVGKGLRTAPRDALLAESVEPGERGRAFGLHRAADTAGAVLGVALALAALWAWGEAPSTVRNVVLVGALLGLATLVPLAFVKEAHAVAPARAVRDEPASPGFGRFVALTGLFALGNVSYMFFVLRAADAAQGAFGAVALYLLFNLVYVATAYPLGRLADRVGKPRVLVGAWLLFAATAALYALPPTLPLALGGFVLMGVAFAGFEGVQRAHAADLAGARGRATRLGLFHATVGVSTLAGGLVAGLLWDHAAPWATFAFAAAVSAVAALGLLTSARGSPRSPASPPSPGTRA